MESQIYPLAVQPEESGDHLNRDFIQRAANQIQKFIPEQTHTCQCIKVILVPTERPGHSMELIMDGQSAVSRLSEWVKIEIAGDSHFNIRKRRPILVGSSDCHLISEIKKNGGRIS